MKTPIGGIITTFEREDVDHSQGYHGRGLGATLEVGDQDWTALHTWEIIFSSGVHMGTVHFCVAEGTVFHPQAFVSSQWERTVTSQCSPLRSSWKSPMHPVCQGRAHTCRNLRPSSNSSGTRALKFQVGRQVAVHALWVSCPLGTRFSRKVDAHLEQSTDFLACFLSSVRESALWEEIPVMNFSRSKEEQGLLHQRSSCPPGCAK